VTHALLTISSSCSQYWPDGTAVTVFNTDGTVRLNHGTRHLGLSGSAINHSRAVVTTPAGTTLRSFFYVKHYLKISYYISFELYPCIHGPLSVWLRITIAIWRWWRGSLPGNRLFKFKRPRSLSNYARHLPVSTVVSASDLPNRSPSLLCIRGDSQSLTMRPIGSGPGPAAQEYQRRVVSSTHLLFFARWIGTKF
jgi:hypothetical protein